jgi:hexosaminidase
MFYLLLIAASSAQSAAESPLLWPIPQAIQVSGSPTPLAASFAFVEPNGLVTELASKSTLLQRALSRYNSLLRNFSWAPAHLGGTLSSCTVTAESPSEILGMATLEDYNLTVNAGTTCSIKCATVFGCLHGLESFLQLVNVTHSSKVSGRSIHCLTCSDYCCHFLYLEPNHQALTLPYSDIVINDSPDFVHRGVMVDSGRRIWPVEVLENMIEVMAINKMVSATLLIIPGAT